MNVDLDDAEARGAELVLWCDGIDDAGVPALDGFTTRGRYVGRLLIDAVDEIRSERSCRTALQGRLEVLEGQVRRLHLELERAREGQHQETACAA